MERSRDQYHEVGGDDLTDEQLVVGAARGDRASFAALYARHAQILLALATRILREPREAEDLVHDVFVEIWRAVGDFDPARGTVRSWMLIRLRSRAIDRVRSKREVRIQLESDASDEPVSAAQPGLVEGRRVSGLLAELSDEQQQVLELGYFQGLSSQEIANELRIPIGTVKSRVAAALAQLRRRLGIEGGKEVTR